MQGVRESELIGVDVGCVGRVSSLIWLWQALRSFWRIPQGRRRLAAGCGICRVMLRKPRIKKFFCDFAISLHAVNRILKLLDLITKSPIFLFQTMDLQRVDLEKALDCLEWTCFQVLACIRITADPWTTVRGMGAQNW